MSSEIMLMACLMPQVNDQITTFDVMKKENKKKFNYPC